MFGKIFESLFTGSMVGAGSHVFAVWSYVIANQRPDRKVGSQVDLNPRLLAAIIGEKQERIQEAIDFLCSPDPESRSRAEGGRRLVQLGQFSYKVVNGEKYRQIRNEEERRIQNREAQQRYRDKKSGKKVGGLFKSREQRFVQAVEDGNEALANEIASEGLPSSESKNLTSGQPDASNTLPKGF
jgi:hypothetical protein